MLIKNRRTRSGLILLVVLSMLTLFSLLSITYVVFSSQARTASMGMARKDFRGTPPTTLLDESIRQVLRGTDTKSALWKHDLLGDLYGSSSALNDDFVTLFARTSTRDNPQRSNRLTSGQWLMTGALPPISPSLEAVQIFGGSMLKIPLEWNAALPEQHDVWNGRVLSFTSGPLSGLSFRVIRYLGEISELAPPMNVPAYLQYDHSLQYSIIIDIANVEQASLSSFLASSASAHSLLYDTSVTPNTSYGMHLNAGPMNSYGSGVSIDSSIADQTAATAPIIGFLNLPFPPSTPTEPYRNIATALLANYSYTRMANTSFTPSGDGDEPYDAPDFTTYALSYVFPSASTPTSEDVIPSFHRPAVVNYIYSKLVTAKALTDSSYAPIDLFSMIELMQRACARPLSFSVRVGGNVVQQNASFSGSNLGDYPLQASELDIDFNNWGPTEHEKLQAWVRWLERGPWDIDNDGNGITDSVWTDINLPLMTSPEGKLLKMMAAFYIEDLGGRLDINATGNREQTLASFSSFSAGTPNNRYAYASASGLQLPQGLGFGPADISLRHLFNSDNEYARLIAERSGATLATLPADFATFGPGADGATTNDDASALRERHRKNHNASVMPGLPMSIFGRSGLGLDLFGNPLIYDDGVSSEINDDPYEARLRSGYRDSMISIAEWERLYRVNDWDRTKLPKRLERLLGSSAIGAISSITPISSSLSVPRFGGIVQHDRIDPNSPAPPAAPVTQRVTRRVTSYPDLFEALMQVRNPKPALPASPPNPPTPFPPPAAMRLPNFTEEALTQLLPLEFKMNLPLDPNRPFGNGFDDDNDGLIDEQDELRGQSLDDNGNGIEDEPAELGMPGHQRAEYPAGSGLALVEQYDVRGTFYDARFEGGPSQTTPAWTSPEEIQYFNGNQGRQLFARHLYCLAQLIFPADYRFANRNSSTVTATVTPIERASILAQWAVNVVDYRDSDAAMTRFPYDVDPFTQDTATGQYWVPDGGVVWGQEQPELLLTETLAFHDTRIAEKNNPTPAENRWQQLRVPQGSLFLELMCPRSPGSSPQHPGMPKGQIVPGAGSFYSVVAGQQALNVEAITPADPNGNQFPVWRVLLTDPHPEADAVHTLYGLPATRRTSHYQTAAQAGLVWSDAASPPAAPNINRVVWFTRAISPGTDNLALPGVTGMVPEKVYTNRASTTVQPSPMSLLGGQYLVVGPRTDTYIGQREQMSSPPEHRPSYHRVSLQSNWAQLWSDENHPGLWRGTTAPIPLPNTEPVPPMASFVRSCVTMPSAADAPAGWATVTTPIGLNISEPTPNAYYPEPSNQLNSMDGGTDADTGAAGFQLLDPDAYVDLSANPMANSPHDPMDLDLTRPLGQFSWNMQGGKDTRPNVESRSNWSTALLQRLANPERPWNEALNPYITVDWMPIDLTVFTGEDVIPPDVSPTDFHFGSRQKTGLYTGFADNVSSVTDSALAPKAGRTLYSYHTEASPTAIPASGVTERPNFRFAMPMELKDVAMTVDTPQPRLGASPAFQHIGDFITLGYLNSRFGLRGMNGEATHVDYPGSPVYYESGTARAPLAPFLANRDYVNSYELMNVPLTSVGQFMQEFTAEVLPGSEFAFQHLLDFEMTVGANATGVTSKSASLLLEVIAPRSPWVESEKTVDPSNLYVATPSTTPQFLANRGLSIYRAPFNRFPSFADFGRVNVNTAAQSNVFRGVVWSSMTPASTRNTATMPFQADFASSRANPLGNPGPPLTELPVPRNARLDARVPTEFAGAMKPGFAVDKACLTALEADNPVAVSLLRSKVGGNNRLFATSELMPGVQLPHNAFVHNSAVSKLANLTTDHSNVFAVRVTIGYFEFDPQTTGLGAEYGLDEGKARRHRGFYVIDRSVPVAYQEGKDLNTDKCILIRRIIE